MVRWQIIVCELLIIIFLLIDRSCKRENIQGCNRDSVDVDKCIKPSTHPSEGYCHNYKEIFAPPGTKWQKPVDCWNAVQKDCDCLDNYVISFGKKEGHRSHRCLCDTESPCVHFVQGPEASGVDGYTRYGLSTYDGKCPPDLPTASFDDVGVGYCEAYKDLANAPSVEQCWYNVLKDPECVDKIEFSYAKPDGSRAERCLCDTVLPCTHLKGLNLGGSGYDRWFSNLPEPPAAPVYEFIWKGSGYCKSNFAELERVPSKEECWEQIQNAPACISKNLFSYGKPGAMRDSRCLCDTSTAPTGCPSIGGENLGVAGYDRWERTLVLPSGTIFTNEEDGYCAQYSDLKDLFLTKETCWRAIQNAPACINKNIFSYGKPEGKREFRCLCDTIDSCRHISGKDLGVEGYDRWREG